MAGMLIADLEAVLEKLAPRALAEPGDNCGLLVGDPSAPVRRVLVALELTEPGACRSHCGRLRHGADSSSAAVLSAQLPRRITSAGADGAGADTGPDEPACLPHQSRQRREAWPISRRRHWA